MPTRATTQSNNFLLVPLMHVYIELARYQLSCTPTIVAQLKHMEAQARVDHNWIQKRGSKATDQPSVEKPAVQARQQSTQTSYSIDVISPNVEASSSQDATSIDHGFDRGINETNRDSQSRSHTADSSLSSLASNASNEASTSLLSVVHSALSHTDSNDLTYPSPIQVSPQSHSPFSPVAWTPTTSNPLTPVTTPGELSLQDNTSSSTQLSEILYKKRHRRIEDEDTLNERGRSAAAAGKVSKSPDISDTSFQGTFAGLKKMLQRIRATSISPSPQKRYYGSTKVSKVIGIATTKATPTKSSSAEEILPDNQCSSVHNNAGRSPMTAPGSTTPPGRYMSSRASPGSEMTPNTSPGGDESLRAISPLKSALKSLRKLHLRKTPLESSEETSHAPPGDSGCQPSNRVHALSRLQSELMSYLSPSPQQSRHRRKNSPHSRRKVSEDRGSKYKNEFKRHKSKDATHNRFVFCLITVLPAMDLRHRHTCVDYITGFSIKKTAFTSRCGNETPKMNPADVVKTKEMRIGVIPVKSWAWRRKPGNRRVDFASGFEC